MKILHVETGRHFLGGPQQVVYLINALRERGHENILVCPPDSGIDRVARKADIPVQNLTCAGDLDLRFAFRLSRLIKEQPPDIVHCHSRRGADFLGGLAASRRGVPAIVSRRVDNTEMHLMAKLRYKPFRKVVAISEAIAAVLRDHKIAEEKIAVIRSAVDADAFDHTPNCETFRREFGFENDHVTIAAAGQLIQRKGHRYLLQAVAGLHQKYPRIRLVIFGEGPLNESLQDSAASLGIDDIVQFAGFRGDLDNFVGCFDIFAHPALSEGLGVAALKASAAGVPVVAFRAGGLDEVIAHEKTGLLVPCEDEDALNNAIEALINDAEMRQRMGAAGRERMRNEFSISEMANKYEALYASL